MDWLDLLAVRGTLKSLLQHHSSKASILGHFAFFMVQHSHLCMTSGKTIALTIWTFVSKVMSLLLISSPVIYSLLIYTSGNPFPTHTHIHISSFDFLAFFLSWETVETVSDFILGGSQITADGDCSHEIKRCLLLGRKVMTILLLLLLSRFRRVRLCATP